MQFGLGRSIRQRIYFDQYYYLMIQVLNFDFKQCYLAMVYNSLIGVVVQTSFYAHLLACKMDSNLLLSSVDEK